MSNIQLFQPGGAGTLLADGNVQTGVRCYLSAFGVTAATWTLTSVPPGSSAVARQNSRLGWYFDPDVRSEVPYVVQMTDSLSAVHTGNFFASNRPVTPVISETASTVQAEWFGVVADGKMFSDGIVTAGSKVLESPASNFTLSDVGKSILLRTASRLAQDLLTVTSGNTVATVLGPNQVTDMPVIGGGGATGQPASGGCIYTDGHYYVVQFSVPSTMQFALAATPTVSSTAKPYYTEVQLATKIVRLIDSTHVELADAAAISETSVDGRYATDSTTAIDDAHRFAFTSGAGRLTFPSGLIGISSNLVYDGRGPLKIGGHGATGCTFMELRKISSETPFPNAANSLGALSYVNCDGIELCDIGYDGAVPVFFTVHSAGGVVNASGSRIGFFMRNCTNSSFLRLRSEGFGARDEHLYVDGQSTNFLFDGCSVLNTNGVSLNFAAGFDGFGVPAGKGLRIVNCFCAGILVSSGSYIISACDVTGNNVAGYGAAIVVDCIGNGIISGCTLHDIVHFQGTGLIDVFGNADVNGVLIISNNTFRDTLHPAYTGGGAVIHLNNFRGTALISNNLSKAVDSTAPSGRYVYIEGVNTGQIFVGRNAWHGNANMSIGNAVAANVPTNAVTFAPGTVFDGNVTTRWSLGAACQMPVDRGYQMEKRSDPPNPAANLGVTYMRDNGSGKVQFCAIFPTGAVQVIATEP